MKYRKRPIIIDAIQFVVFETNPMNFPKYFDAHGIRFPIMQYAIGKPYIIIPTLEGNMECKNLDWIIKGIKGECYSCKPDIFEKSYEKV